MDKESLKFLQELCDIAGPPGFEAEASKLVKRYVEGYCDKVYNDNMGNMMFEKVGRKDGPTVLIAGHIDECGFIITGINPQGYLSFSQLGGWFDQVLLGHRVLVHTNKGVLNGVDRLQAPAPDGRGGDQEGGDQGQDVHRRRCSQQGRGAGLGR